MILASNLIRINLLIIDPEHQNHLILVANYLAFVSGNRQFGLPCSAMGKGNLLPGATDCFNVF